MPRKAHDLGAEGAARTGPHNSVITRHAKLRDTVSDAVYSECGTYRYSLTRIWNQGGRRLLYIMLNPSTATEAQNDPTIARCESRARALGYGSFRACNLFALRETDPWAMRRHAAPEGPDNRTALLDAAAWADDILCAWGIHGTHLDQGPAIRQMLTGAGHTLMMLGLTKESHPRHPLYLRNDLTPKPWSASDP